MKECYDLKHKCEEQGHLIKILEVENSSVELLTYRITKNN